jgi:uncharacterized protein YjbI with pentapeptide repeats
VSDVELTTVDPERVRERLGRGHGAPWVRRRCVLDELDLSGVDLTAATLDRVQAAAVRLPGAVLGGPHVEGGSLAGADLRGADLGEITPETPAMLRGAIVSTDQPPTCAARWACRWLR